MFLSSLPIAISIISSNVGFAASTMSSRRERVKQSFLSTIQFDLILLTSALFVVAAIETAQNAQVELWRTLYEVVSAYGTGMHHSYLPFSLQFCAHCYRYCLLIDS